MLQTMKQNQILPKRVVNPLAGTSTVVANHQRSGRIAQVGILLGKILEEHRILAGMKGDITVLDLQDSFLEIINQAAEIRAKPKREKVITIPVSALPILNEKFQETGSIMQLIMC